MTRSQIEYLLALEATRNFSRAADACYVTQSTLSAMVAKFEQQVGVEIFDRKTKPIGITPSGEKILKAVQNIYREYQLLDEQVNVINGKSTDALSIACIPTVAPYLYPLVLDKIMQKHKNIQFTIYEFTTEKVIDEIIAGNIDIGIVSTPLTHPDLQEYPLYEEDFVLYDCGPQNRKQNLAIKDIDLNRLWLLEEGHCFRNQVQSICDLRSASPPKRNLTYNCGTIYTLIEMVNNNKGLTLLPRLSTIDNAKINPKNLYEITAPQPVREIGLITHRHFVSHSILKSIIKTIRHEMRQCQQEQSDRIVLNPLHIS